ncbi:MAG: NAD-dependent epimerase/dehydratase family protein [Solirubrobacteraceae bacterium]
MSEVLITGGNGFVGRHLVEALQVGGETVRVLALPGENTVDLEQRGVSIYRGDVRHPETLRAAVAGARAVVHLAAMMDVWRPLREYQAVNVVGTQNVCRAALVAGVRRVVHMSSSSVYGVGLGRIADEAFPLAPFPDPYPVTKAAADMAVQRLVAEERLPAVIVRPDQIFGPGDHLHFGRIADRLRAGRSIIVGGGDNALPFVYITDVVQALLLALEHEGAVGNAYNITAEQPLSQQDVLETIASKIGAGPPRVHVPYRVLYAVGYLAERLAALTPSASRPAITRLGVAFFGTDNRYSMQRARCELGYRPKVTVTEGLRLTAVWYRRQETPSAAPEAPPAVAAAASSSQDD